MVPDTTSTGESNTNEFSAGDIISVKDVDGQIIVSARVVESYCDSYEVCKLEDSYGNPIEDMLVKDAGYWTLGSDDVRVDKVFNPDELGADGPEHLKDDPENDDTGADNIWVAAPDDDGARLVTNGGIDDRPNPQYEMDMADRAESTIINLKPASEEKYTAIIRHAPTPYGDVVEYMGRGVIEARYEEDAKLALENWLDYALHEVITEEMDLAPPYISEGDFAVDIDPETREYTVTRKPKTGDREDIDHDPQTVYVVVRDLNENHHVIGGGIAGVYGTREAADAHVEDINNSPWEIAEVQAQPIKDVFEVMKSEALAHQ